MLGQRPKFDPWFAVAPTLAAMFGAGVLLTLLVPPLAWLGGWLVLIPAVLVGAALVLAVLANVIGRWLR